MSSSQRPYLTFTENATGEFTLYVADDDGGVIDLTGCTVLMQFRDAEIDGTVVIELEQVGDDDTEGLYVSEPSEGVILGRIDFATLAAADDDTGDFDLWWDLLVTRADTTRFVANNAPLIARVRRGVTHPA
jgi:hypothetical protein